MNYWFYLLSVGKTGTNDKGTAYNVQGITIGKAAKIAFRTLTTYLTASSQYANARTAAIQSATDLYGATSNEVRQTTNAWCAVGVGACATFFAPGSGTVSRSVSTNVSPNPAQGSVSLTVASLFEGDANILITNILGQTVWSKNAYLPKGQTTETIDVSKWSKGLYSIRIQQGAEVQTEKLIVE